MFKNNLFIWIIGNIILVNVCKFLTNAFTRYTILFLIKSNFLISFFRDMNCK